MAKIYIARSDVAAAGEHSYFVFDPDGNPNTGDERVIRGGPVGGGSGEYAIEADRPIASSRDALNGDDPFDDRYYTTVASGTEQDMQNLWDVMVQAAKDAGTEVDDPLHSGQKMYTLPEDDYFLFDPNCNTLTNTVGIAGSIDVLANLPKVGGDPGSGERMPAAQYVGIKSIFGTTGDDTHNLGAPTATNIFDQGGADTYVFDVGVYGGSPGTIDIFEDVDSGTIDKIVLVNVDPEDVLFARALNGDLLIYLEGRDLPMIRIHDQFDDSVPKINTLWVDPPGAGDPEILPLNNPDDFPLGQPIPVGGWMPGVTVPFGQSENTISPIVLDVDASGTIELVALNASGSVYWDIDQDGFAEASGWITGGDGLLAIDLNSDGVINDHGELFGGTNGYVTLDAYDTDNNNAITSADTQFGDLLVWIDSNADGYSQSGELHSLTSLGITSIATSYSNVNYTIAGNQVSFQSTFVMNGNTYTSVDAFFAYDNVNSRYAEDYTLDMRALFLPTLRGYGTLPDLHIAMSLDEDLLEMVQDLVTSSPSDVLGLLTTPDSGAIRDIMFRWAGVDGVSPSSRGGFMADARTLEFLEEFMGRDYSQVGVGPNPGSTTAAELVMKAWGNAYVEIAARLVYQTMAGGLFEGGPTYNPISDGFEGTLSLETAEAWMEAAETPLDAFNTGWLIVKMIDDTVGIASLSAGELEDLQEILPWGITIEAFQNTIVQSGPTSGSSDDELILGLTADQIFANGGNDLLIGGGGNDDLRGGAGDDTYIFAAGSASDQINAETSGTDTIRFVGYDAADVRLWTTENGTLYLYTAS